MIERHNCVGIFAVRPRCRQICARMNERASARRADVILDKNHFTRGITLLMRNWVDRTRSGTSLSVNPNFIAIIRRAKRPSICTKLCVRIIVRHETNRPPGYDRGGYMRVHPKIELISNTVPISSRNFFPLALDTSVEKEKERAKFRP